MDCLCHVEWSHALILRGRTVLSVNCWCESVQLQGKQMAICRGHPCLVHSMRMGCDMEYGCWHGRSYMAWHLFVCIHFEVCPAMVLSRRILPIAWLL